MAGDAPIEKPLPVPLITPIHREHDSLFEGHTKIGARYYGFLGVQRTRQHVLRHGILDRFEDRGKGFIGLCTHAGLSRPSIVHRPSEQVPHGAIVLPTIHLPQEAGELAVIRRPPAAPLGELADDILWRRAFWFDAVRVFSDRG